MSTTDTRAAFVAAKAKMIRTGDGWTDFEMFEAGHKAATKAAKATGTAGEPEYCPACHGSGESTVMDGAGPYAGEVPCNCPHCNGTGALIDAYNGVVALLAEANRKYLELCGKQWAAARQPAPVLPVKTWHERVGYPANALPANKIESAMKQEIAELRAALAATAAPVMQPEMKKIGWMWKKWGWTVTAHSKHREIHRVMDFNQPPESTKLSPDFISLEPIYIAATNRSQQ